MTFPNFQLGRWLLYLGLSLSVVLSGCKKLIDFFDPETQFDPVHPSPISGYQFVWGDEFSGDSIDEQSWQFRDWETAWLGPVPTMGRKENVSVNDGKMRIAMNIESYVDPETNKSYEVTAGGIQTKQAFKFGYYEASVKLSATKGWHEAFWTFWYNDIDPTTYFPGWETAVRTEIDVFEHLADYDTKTFTYGMYEHTGGWSNAAMTSIHRDMYFGETDLTSQFNTWGFEYTPEYLNYFFNDSLIKTVDVRDVPHREFYIWLSAIATRMPDGDGEMQVDYLRCFEPDTMSTAYQDRRAYFLQVLEDMKGEEQSEGIDLWIQAEDFVDKGGWTVANDDNIVAIKGHPNTTPVNEGARYARTGIIVEEAGTYKLWVRGKDFKNNLPGSRFFNVFVNGGYSLQKYGTHGSDDLYDWQDGGLVYLEEGVNTIEIYDASLYYASCDKILLTTDHDFQPTGFGGETNVEHVSVNPPVEPTSLWVEAEDFVELGGWIVANDTGNEVIKGQVDRVIPEDETLRYAKTKIAIEEAGTYRLWVRGKDFKNNWPGTRHFEVLIDGVPATQRFGTHAADELFAWESGGEFVIESGDVIIEIYDSSCYYATCDKILLTNDLAYVPEGIGETQNVVHKPLLP